MMVVFAGASTWSGLVMGHSVPMDNIDVPPIVSLDAVNMLGWKEGQAEHTRHGKARKPAAQIAVQHHRIIIGTSGFRVKHAVANSVHGHQASWGSSVTALPREASENTTAIVNPTRAMTWNMRA